jgi:hypothetical protein
MNKIAIFVIVAVAVQCTLSAPQRDQREYSSTTPVPILHQEADHDGFGNFHNSFETGNGIKEENSGNLKTIKVPKYDDKGNVVGDEDAYAQVQSGSYSYVQEDGSVIELR